MEQMECLQGTFSIQEVSTDGTFSIEEDSTEGTFSIDEDSTDRTVLTELELEVGEKLAA